MMDKTTSTVEDSTSNSNDGVKTAANEPIEADGKIAKAQNFDGTNDLISASHSTSLNITGVFTVSAWLKLDAYVAGKVPNVAAKNTDLTGYGLWLFDSPEIRGVIGSGSGWVFSPGYVLSTGVYNYYATVYDGSYLRLYVDGVEYGIPTSNTVNPVTNAADLIVGRHYSAAQWLDGIIDEVRISDIPRDAAWIKASFNSGNDSLVSYGSEEALPTELLDIIILSPKKSRLRTAPLLGR